MSNFTVQLAPPTTARRCIRCAQLITFNWEEYPIVNNRREMRVVATFYAHPTAEACQNDIELARRLDRGEQPTAWDIGLQRAALLRALVTQAQDAMLAQMPEGVAP